MSLQVFTSCLGCVWRSGGGVEDPRKTQETKDGDRLLYIIKEWEEIWTCKVEEDLQEK